MYSNTCVYMSCAYIFVLCDWKAKVPIVIWTVAPSFILLVHNFTTFWSKKIKFFTKRQKQQVHCNSWELARCNRGSLDFQEKKTLSATLKHSSLEFFTEKNWKFWQKFEKKKNEKVSENLKILIHFRKLWCMKNLIGVNAMNFFGVFL